jgi:acyl-CoA synthetase (AMP-forming)/AMP-acid ligase II
MEGFLVKASFFDINCSLSSLVDVVRWRALHHPDECAFTYLHSDAEELHLSYGELDLQARAIGATLQSQLFPGARALLLYSPGPDFIAAFLGCLYASVIAVPTYLPRATRQNGGLLTLCSIANNAHPAVILTRSTLMASLRTTLEQVPDFHDIPFLPTDTIHNAKAQEWQQGKIDGDTLAFLQYTSGSTGSPKGVMLSHSNLLHNISLISKSFNIPKSMVCWLPPYHDMGLIGNILGSLCVHATPATILAPIAFLQHPYRWLSTISKTRADTSGAPNFAYDLCVRRITAQQRDTLDLSCWRVAFTGAEPIRRETLDRFTEFFAPCGFRPEAFYPCYGLAEATLFVTGGPAETLPTVQTFDEKELTHNRAVPVPAHHDHAQTLVSCGHVSPEAHVVIVDPETLKPCAPNEVGEIWVTGPGVACGYWNRPEETTATFKAYIAGSEDGPFLRTGDLGVVIDDQLFVTGRLKDLIIIRGQNFYPQDLELVVENCHDAIRLNCCAAFSIQGQDKEELVVAAEIDPRCIPENVTRSSGSSHRFTKINMQDLITTIRRSIAEQFELSVSHVALLNAGGLPRTSSGKIQRRVCREDFLTDSLSRWGN